MRRIIGGGSAAAGTRCRRLPPRAPARGRAGRPRLRARHRRAAPRSPAGTAVGQAVRIDRTRGYSPTARQNARLRRGRRCPDPAHHDVRPARTEAARRRAAAAARGRDAARPGGRCLARRRRRAGGEGAAGHRGLAHGDHHGRCWPASPSPTCWCATSPTQSFAWTEEFSVFLMIVLALVGRLGRGGARPAHPHRVLLRQRLDGAAAAPGAASAR